jgi:hypothetical protein
MPTEVSAILLGLFFILLGVLQIRHPARIIESRRGLWKRQRAEFVSPERFGCFNLSISLLMLVTGVLLVWWGLTSGRAQA